MMSPQLVLQVLRAELRAAGLTHKALAQRIGMSESSVKRMFGHGDMSLSRLAQICQAAGIGLDEVLHQAAAAAPRADTLTLVQEQALMRDPTLLLVAICCLGDWTLEQIVETYTLTAAECIVQLAALDRLGLIELRPLNRYRLGVSATFHWHPDGPVQQYFRDHVAGDYFAGRFDGPGECLLCVPARLSEASAREIELKIGQLAAELARLQQDDRRLAPRRRDGYTLLVGLRSWEFSAFTVLRRAAPAHQIGPRNR